MDDKITVETFIEAPIEKVWSSYVTPESITEWNAASDDWYCPKAENDLRPGGRFSFRMEAKDGSEGFDFGGTYDEVIEHAEISYVMDDGRGAIVVFVPEEEGTRVTVAFTPETENSRELQQEGWQAILDNFKTYTERIG